MLEAWGALTDARRFAEQGMKGVTAGNRDELAAGVRTYARVLARLRAYDAAAPDVLVTGAQQIAWVVGQYYSPDEKAKYGAWVQTHPRLALLEGAGMADVEAKMRFQNLMAQPTAPAAQANKEALVQLQKRRLAFDELGTQLEALDRARLTSGAGGAPNGASSDGDLTEAAAAYRASGNVAAELRVLQAQNSRGPLNGPLLDRYGQLLLASPQRIVAVIGREGRVDVANALVNYAMEHVPTSMTAPPATGAQQSIVFQAISARGQRRGPSTGPMWTNAYTALAGLYLESNAVPVRAAFPALLGDMTIGSRIGKPVDRNHQLAGDLWFYYGGRYGEYLGTIKQSGAEDYLPAMVEARPQESQPYFDLAEYFRGSGDTAAAATDYRNALELNAGRADAHDRLALIAANQGRRDEAIQEWKLAVAALTDTMNRGPAPPRFWVDASDVLHHIGDAKLLAQLRDDLDKMLRAYVHRNGGYQVDALLEGVLAASGDAAAAIEWIGELSRVAADPPAFLGSLADRSWFPEGQKSALYRRVVETAEAKVAASFGEQRGYAQSELWMRQIARARHMVAHGEAAGAGEIVAALPVEEAELV